MSGRPGWEVPVPGEHGGDARALARALGMPLSDILDLSATMNPLAPDVVSLVRRHAEEVRTYPDPTAATIALATQIGIDPERVLLTNGGAEAIALVAGELERAAVVEPEFSLWRRHLATVEEAPSGAIGRVRSNPNNPTGALAPLDERAAAWDEAFFPLATGRWTRGDADRGAIVVGSLTKLFACPGLRLGYVLAPRADLIHRLRLRQSMWSVNSLALGVLPALLEQANLAHWSGAISTLRAALLAAFADRGFDVVASDAPWVLVRHAAWLRAPLAREGVLVRDCGSFGLTGTVRVAVPNQTGLARLVAALDRARAQ
ncbi:MAG TPA: aminotransferase class I/II-fold pyridoxal phosphate-dependent enzyme [Chloroflexota bacterium]|nr:aminotransferase class I/II-fold pyridoxal phosphate-dependent enzyme [Chloroflexota bacterium]